MYTSSCNAHTIITDQSGKPHNALHSTSQLGCTTDLKIMHSNHIMVPVHCLPD